MDTAVYKQQLDALVSYAKDLIATLLRDPRAIIERASTVEVDKDDSEIEYFLMYLEEDIAGTAVDVSITSSPPELAISFDDFTLTMELPSDIISRFDKILKDWFEKLFD